MKQTGFVYMNEEGKFLVLSERTTHTGHHVDLSFTEDINRATVLVRFERKHLDAARSGYLESLHPIPVELEVVRIVRVTLRSPACQALQEAGK